MPMFMWVSGCGGCVCRGGGGDVGVFVGSTDPISCCRFAAVCKTLGSELCWAHRDCVVSALTLASLLAEQNKNAAKRLRKVGGISNVQDILMHYSALEGSEALTKIIVLMPAKDCLTHLWFGNKKKRKRN